MEMLEPYKLPKAISFSKAISLKYGKKQPFADVLQTRCS